MRQTADDVLHVDGQFSFLCRFPDSDPQILSHKQEDGSAALKMEIIMHQWDFWQDISKG